MSGSVMSNAFRSARSSVAAAALALACAGAAGCASYAAPGGAADMGVMGGLA